MRASSAPPAWRACFRVPVLIALVVLTSLSFVAPGAAQVPGLPQAAAPAAADAEAGATVPLQTLIEVLRDETARTELIDQLEAQLASDGGAVEPAEEAPTEASLTGSLSGIGEQVAETTRSGLAQIAAGITSAWDQISSVPGEVAALGQTDLVEISNAVSLIALELAVIVVITYGAFWLLRYLTGRLRHRLNTEAPRSGVLYVVGAVLLLAVIGVGQVLVSWGLGNAAALALASGGEPPLHHALFLNAFLVVEFTQVFVRAVFAPDRPRLRFLRISDQMARMLSRWCRLAVSAFVFTQLLFVPVLERFVSAPLAQAVEVIGNLVVIAMIANLVLRVRLPFGDFLVRVFGSKPNREPMARLWYVPVLVYLLVLVVIVIAWPPDVITSVLLASLQAIIAVTLGFVIAGLLSRVILSGVRVPPEIGTRIPLLEQRLNAFVPRALTVLRVVVVVVVAAITLDTIGIFSISGWLASEFGARVASASITVAIIVTVAFLVWLVLSSWIDYRIEPVPGRTVKARERTLLVLFKNAASIFLVVLASMFVLSEIGLDITPLLASAGIIGVAVGFGAQSLVKDIITGVFIQLEGAIDVGDVVTIGSISGSVERLTIRSASLRDANGVYHVVPFSSVTTVSNFMRGYAYAVVEITMPQTERLELVRAALDGAFTTLKADPDLSADIVENSYDFLGVDRFPDAANMVVRARVKTPPGRQFAVTRAFNGLAKAALEEMRARATADKLPPSGEAAGDAELAITERTEGVAKALKPRRRRRREPEPPS